MLALDSGYGSEYNMLASEQTVLDMAPAHADALCAMGYVHPLFRVEG